MISKIKEFCSDFLSCAIHKHNAPLWDFFPLFLLVSAFLQQFSIINFNHLASLFFIYFFFAFMFTYYNMVKYFSEDDEWKSVIKELETEKNPEKINILLERFKELAPTYPMKESPNYSLELCKEAFHSYFLNLFRKK